MYTNTNLTRIQTVMSPGSINYFYNLKKVIGEGAYSTVYLASKKDDDEQLVAIKRIPKAKAFDNMDLYKEVCLLRKLGSHININAFIALHEDKRYYYLVIEYIEGGELLNVIIDHFNNGGSYSEAVVATIMRQIVMGLNHCHKNDVIHLDLKPENILVERTTDFSDAVKIPKNAFKLADFGVSVELREGQFITSNDSGTPFYMSPERLKNLPFSYPSDIWSVGVIMYVLMAGKFPFFGNSPAEILVCINDKPDYDCISSASPECLAFLKKCLEVNPALRPTCDELLNDRWLTGECASTHEIAGAVEALRRHNARQKFKAGVRALMAAKRMVQFKNGLMGEKVTSNLQKLGFNKVKLEKLNGLLNSTTSGITPTNSVIDLPTMKQAFRDTEPNVQNEDLEKLFEAFAEDEDKTKVDPRNLCLALALKVSRDHNEVLSLAFDIFDSNHSNGMDVDEYKRMVNFLTRTDSKKVNEFTLEDEFNEVDADNDQIISKAEFLKMAERNNRIRNCLKRVSNILEK